MVLSPYSWSPPVLEVSLKSTRLAQERWRARDRHSRRSRLPFCADAVFELAAEQRDELAAFQLIELHSVPASQGRITGYRIGRDQSAGTQAVIQPDSRWHCAPEVRSGSKLRHGADVRCKTVFPPKAEVHPRSCYVAQVPNKRNSRRPRAAI